MADELQPVFEYCCATYNHQFLDNYSYELLHRCSQHQTILRTHAAETTIQNVICVTSLPSPPPPQTNRTTKVNSKGVPNWLPHPLKMGMCREMRLVLPELHGRHYSDVQQMFSISNHIPIARGSSSHTV